LGKKANVKELLDRAERLRGLRQNWEAYWQDVLYFAIPRKSYITRTKQEGDRLPLDVYDSAAIEALRIFAAGLAGYLTNPSAKWFNLRTEDRNLSDDKEVKVWLKDSEDKINDTLNGSNFYASIHEAYLDFGSIGLCCIFIEEDIEDMVRFYTRPIKEIFIDQNEREVIDTVYREFEWTVRQMYRKWGDDCPKEVVDKFNKNKFEDKYKIIHCVEPRYDYHPGKKDNLNMPFMSVYIEKNSKKKLSESGFKSFPYMIAGANKESGEIYFTSPLMECFSDTKMVNRMAYTTLLAGMMGTLPPLDVPSDGFLNALNLNPGAINYRNPATPGDNNEVRPIVTGANSGIGFEFITRVEQKIQRALFVDLFLALAQRDPRMTATEVIAREQERMLLLGPMLGRLTEMFSQIIKRTFSILQEKGIILPIPQALLPQPGQNPQSLIVEYVSPLARAQKSSEMKSIQNTIIMVGQLAQANPQVLDKIDLDKTVDEIADIEGINPELIRDASEVAEIRQARATAEEAVKKMQMAASGAQIAKDAGAASKSMAEAKGAEGMQ
jgi:hypothetical protein